MKNFNRRNFLKIAGVAAAGVAGASLGQKRGPLPDVGKGDAWPDRDEHRELSVCQLCPGGCGVRARVVDGRVVKVEGNPFHPVNKGRLCPVGQASLQLLYHPDRLRTPMIRDAGNNLRPAPWEEAISLVAQKLKSLRGQGDAHSMVFLAGSYRGLRERFLRRFMVSFGSPNYIRARENSPEEPDPADVLLQGVDRPVSPDLFSAKSILSFSAPLLEGGISPVYQMRAYGHFRQGGDRSRGVLIQIEPRRSATAERADKWVSIRPGTETVFALGIAHTLILEHLYDEDFVTRYCVGFNDSVGPDGQTVPGFRTIVLRDFRLPIVSEATGVSVETILSVSRAFAKNQPGVAIGTPELPNGSTRLGLRLAVRYLNALVGNFGRPGGMHLQGEVPLGGWKIPEKDILGQNSLAQPRIDGAKKGFYALADDASETLPQKILTSKPYAVKALLVAGLDPLFDHPRNKDFAEAIERVPFVVSFSSMPDAITRKAHVVLPDAMFLERWTEDVNSHLAGFSSFSVGQPVVRSEDSPLGLEDTLLKVAKKIGGPVAESFKWNAFSDAIFEAAAPLAKAGHGYIAADPIKEQFRTILTRQGYWQEEFKDPKQFWKALLNSGAWWDAGDETQGAGSQFLHPTHKFQFFPNGFDWHLAAMRGQMRQSIERALGLRSIGRNLFPHDYPRPGPKKGEFELILYRPLALISNASAELPWMQEQLGPHVNGRWDSWVEIHPKDAKRLGIRNGDPVELRSESGSLRTQARIFNGVLPGILAIPVGLGRPEGGRWAKGRGADPRVLVRTEKDPIRGMGVSGITTLRIRRIA